MEETMQSGAIELIVPAKQDMMLVVRMAATGALALSGLTLDELADLKMAAEEACSCLIMQPQPCERLKLRFARFPGAVQLTVSGEGCADPRYCEQQPYEMDVVRCILESMADEVAMEGDECGLTAIRITKAIMTGRKPTKGDAKDGRHAELPSS
ncbi:MAG: hypothetical protein GX558_09430 [Clostridiales bacterium]|nr:hypothetical protein [Clostridiales bacterium]